METAYIVCGVTAVAAVLAPVASALITQIGSFNLEKSKLLFSSKFDAYKGFIACASLFPLNPSSEEMQELHKCISSAMLLSSVETHKALSIYSSLLLSADNDIAALADAQRNAILSMKKELLFCKWYRV